MTLAGRFFYSRAMDLDLKGLEDRVGRLIALSQRLREDNNRLRQQLVAAQNENKQLAEKVAAARARVESLLAEAQGDASTATGP